MRSISVLLLVLAAINPTPTQATEQAQKQELKETEPMPGYKPAEGLVPDPATAIAIAVAVWTPVYGKKKIAAEAPYQATLRDGQWTVTGSLSKGWVGGTATAVIDKMSGQIIKIFHTK
jgi:hypothetical protein